MSAVPTLTTERLVLRAHEAADLAASFAIWSDPDVVRHISGVPSTREQAWARLLNYRGLWSLLGYGYWAVAERDSGTFVGDVGFADFKRTIEPSMEGMPEAGWVLAPGAAGRGYATEAMRCALQWLDEHGPGRDSVCIIAPENAASIRVAEKCGYRHLVDTQFRDEPTRMFRRADAATERAQV